MTQTTLPPLDARTWLRLQERAHHEFAVRVSAVVDWEGATPDTEWTVRDLVSHVIEEQQWVPWLLSGLTTKQAKSRLRPLEPNLTQEWHRYSLAATTAWHDAGPDSPVNLSYDTVTTLDYLKEQVADVTIHTWDLARATGTAEELDEELVAAVWTVFEPQKDALEASGLFASPVPIGDEAPLQSRLLALTGRDDRR
ncbi:TIGR03086 family metal-binding protein [Herbiconiux moechotypicola]|uniref:TIGR03086 family metal-binding protein n=1 Tax=Herbiconiux moechotypicola TaxID=637393 RepID=A0ABP5QD69_9MICO|nr:TIGR03086 family metal-binding protein [Herbiconiux moechotypicola]MCS5729785.1 TIGR03086 family metal-binding protein [Herbiconiux moechotypicola]